MSKSPLPPTKCTINPLTHINLNFQMEDLNRENQKAREEASKYKKQHGEAVSDKGFICKTIFKS